MTNHGRTRTRCDASKCKEYVEQNHDEAVTDPPPGWWLISVRKSGAAGTGREAWAHACNEPHARSVFDAALAKVSA